MPVNFQTVPGDKSDPNGKLQTMVRKNLNLHDKATVGIGLTDTTITFDGVSLTIPVGMTYLKNSGDFDMIRATIKNMGLSGVVTKDDKFASALDDLTPVGEPEPVVPSLEPYDDMSDEEWCNAVSQKLFPGIVHLHTVNAMHQPVLGTSSGSIYKSCFIGPQLKVAARILNGNVSFRVTTDTNEAPDGDVRAVFERLGVAHVYADRITCHTAMSGDYNTETAGEYRALFGAFYAALRPWITSGFPAIGRLAENVK